MARGSPDSGIDGIVQLDPPLLLPRTIRGRSYDVRLGGTAIRLTLPSGGLEELHISSSSNFDIPLFPEPALAQGKTTSIQAHASISLPLPKQIFAATALRLCWHDCAFEENIGELGVGGQFSKTVGSWLTVVRDWVAAWTGNVRGHVELEATPNVRLTLFGTRV